MILAIAEAFYATLNPCETYDHIKYIACFSKIKIVFQEKKGKMCSEVGRKENAAAFFFLI